MKSTAEEAPVKIRSNKGSTAYNSWNSMRQRCYNKKCKHYAKYGGRGILASDEWASFDVFYADMGAKPFGTSLDRIDNSLGYSKENCRWATQKQQCRNKSKTRKIKDKDGNLVPVCELAEAIGVRSDTFYFRMKVGDTGDRLMRQTRSEIRIEIYGVHFSIQQIAQAVGLPINTMWTRYYKKYLPNMDIDALFAKRKRFQKKEHAKLYNQ